MQYIWEVVLAAEKNGIREADLRYEVAEVRSPYLEVSFCDLNTQTVEQTVVEVNPFYRFFDIFLASGPCVCYTVTAKLEEPNF